MPRRSSETNHLAKRIADVATGEATEELPTRRQLGGVASACRLTAEQRRERARKAVAVSWASA